MLMIGSNFLILSVCLALQVFDNDNVSYYAYGYQVRIFLFISSSISLETVVILSKKGLFSGRNLENMLLYFHKPLLVDMGFLEFKK